MEMERELKLKLKLKLKLGQGAISSYKICIHLVASVPELK